jgi:sugar-specific transcriptional regulator TrmB
MDNHLLANLQETGLSEKEARVYLAMLELGESSIIPIAQRAGIKRTTVYNYLDDFRRLGLISMTVRNRRQHYVAASPARLSELMQARLAKVEEVVPTLFSLYKQEEGKPSVQMFEGVEGIKEVFRLSLETVGKKIDAIPVRSSGHNHVGDEFIVKYLDDTKRKKIAYRSLRPSQDDAEYKKSGYLRYVPTPDDNRQIRIAPEWFTPESHIHMYDDTVAIFSQTKEKPYAMLITSKSYKQTMELFFASLWEQSRPFN